MSGLAPYLDALYGAEPAGGLIEVRRRLPAGGMAASFHAVERRRDAVTLLERLGRETDVYVGVAPRRPFRVDGCQSGGRDAIEHVHVLWADCDEAAAVEALDGFRPAPSVVIHSGHGRHAYWALWPPVGADEAESANRRLVHALGADPRAVDAARILRPPGTVNFKREPVPVVVERMEAELFTLAEVVGCLPPASSEKRSEPWPSHRAGDVLHEVSPRVYVELLTGREVGRDGKVACPFHADPCPRCTPPPSPSAAGCATAAFAAAR